MLRISAFIKENYFNPDGLKIDVQYISYNGRRVGYKSNCKKIALLRHSTGTTKCGMF